MAAKKTLLSAATSTARSRSFGEELGNNDVCITVRGTMGSGSATIDVSHDDGTNWIPTGFTLDASNRCQRLTLSAGMQGSVNYTASGGSSWIVEVS